MIKTKQELLNHFSDINFMYNNPFTYQTLSNMIDELLEQQPNTETHGSTYGGVSWGGTYKPQQPCEDCISRAYIEPIIEELENICVNGDEYILSLLSNIKNAPSVTPQQTRWIPVSERLPEKQDCYLVTTKWKGSYSGDVYIETNMAVYREKPKEWDCADVIAWTPLPQPYAESEE